MVVSISGLYIYTQINKNIFTDTSVYMLDEICSFAVDLVLTIFIIQNVLLMHNGSRQDVNRQKKNVVSEVKKGYSAL